MYRNLLLLTIINALLTILLFFGIIFTQQACNNKEITFLSGGFSSGGGNNLQPGTLNTSFGQPHTSFNNSSRLTTFNDSVACAIEIDSNGRIYIAGFIWQNIIDALLLRHSY